ncbi:MAG: hypothetical protein JL50_09585 [Peptococcaceae bacterium BICA1-7]|nr:MAG: hypothetical protein JL50_09585 [Peptococcaceae bacterium BICA1-7]HBV95532.1 hypothetical protein [Desulfotomaculum sp.]
MDYRDIAHRLLEIIKEADQAGEKCADPATRYAAKYGACAGLIKRLADDLAKLNIKRLEQ